MKGLYYEAQSALPISYSFHALDKLRELTISKDDVERVVSDGNARLTPNGLIREFYGVLADGLGLRVVMASDKRFVITAFFDFGS